MRLSRDRSRHWQDVYARARPDELSWFQSTSRRSLALIAATGKGPGARIVDVGGGASRLVDGLLERGYRHLTVLDLSAPAIAHSRRRLGAAAERVEWIVGDVTAFRPATPYDVWHDRAVLHFLTRRRDRRAYAEALAATLGPAGQAVIATFAPDGPRRCSGLPVRRYGPERIADLVGRVFELLDVQPEAHMTPGGVEQRFLYFRLARRAGG